MKISKELVKGSTVLLVLSLLRRKTMYGYEMMKSLEEASDGAFLFKEGTLYPILHALEQQGMVEAQWRTADSGRQRKYYAMTRRGEAELAAKEAEWERFQQSVQRVRLEGGV